jgi:hypothetical protein
MLALDVIRSKRRRGVFRRKKALGLFVGPLWFGFRRCFLRREWEWFVLWRTIRKVCFLPFVTEFDDTLKMFVSQQVTGAALKDCEEFLASDVWLDA